MSFSDTPEKLFVCDTQRDRQASREEWHGVTYICTHELHALIFLIWLFVFSHFQKIMTYLMDFPMQVSQVLLKKRQSTLLNFPESQIQLNTGRGSGEHETIERKTKPDCWKELPVIIFKVCVPA